MIAIIDYDAGNIKSVEKAIQYLGEDAVITRDRDLILNSDKVIMPGVGSFGDAMAKIREYDLVNTIYDVVDKKTPFLGICLGLQLLFKTSEESEGVTGLGLLDGRIIRIPDAPGLKIPHMGWNSLDIKPGATLFQGIEDQSYVYFVHSYYVDTNPEFITSTANYGIDVPGVVERGRVYGMQFHPEKSGVVGLNLLRAFGNITEAYAAAKQ